MFTLLSLEALAMEVFASEEEIKLWREKVLNEERAKEQKLDITKYNEYSNVTQYGQHSNYSKYSNQGTVPVDKENYEPYHAVGYTANGYERDVWDQAAGYTDTYGHEDKYTQDSGGSGGGGYGDYGRSYGDHANRYYTRKLDNSIDYGFDHANYIPSTPQLYKILGTQVNGQTEFILASYDKNNDGFGSQDADSKKILYTVKIAKKTDLNGKEVKVEDNRTFWDILLGVPAPTGYETIFDGEITDQKVIDLSGYSEGVYEVVAIASNPTRKENSL